MSHIQIMDELLANKIAAGEVVEKTMNVVKELVENSIDAGSDEVKIDLIDSGVKRIVVTDNGIGMSEEDASLAFLRHATSKLVKEEDLFHIRSLGFRGEALPSIASVSEVTLKTSNGEVGTELHLSGGVVTLKQKGALRKGTSVIVEDLFYNTPVRLKYLKNLYTELANIVDYVNKMALSYPEIKFVLTNNDKVLLNTDGSGNLLKVIQKIYGVNTAKRMVPVTMETNDYELSGYVSYPEIMKSNRNSLILFVNGRLIRNNELNKVITDVYHKYMPPDKYPVVVLKLKVDPNLIDVNVHPTKMDIKFSKVVELKEMLSFVLKDCLSKLTLIPHVAVREESVREETVSFSKKLSSYETEELKEAPTIEEMTLDFEVAEPTIEKEPPKERLKEMNPIGIVHATYIVAENEDGMYLIDQHAAAERVNYEKCLSQMTSNHKETIVPLVPLSIELPQDEFLKLKQHFDLLEELGFEVEEFGLNTLIVRRHPIWIPKGYEKPVIQEIMEMIALIDDFDQRKLIHHKAATTACKMSIKANWYVSLEEIKALLDDLRKCENPFNCPHGRPTIITYSNYDLEKLFKRVMD